jgi:hypothetical protein
MENLDDRQLCPGSDLELPSDLVNEWTSRGLCTVCGQEVSVGPVEQSWFLEWHLERLESRPNLEVLPPLR